MSRSGDGWVTCARGHRHWGRFGAAGLLLRRPAEPIPPDEPPGPVQVALHLRSSWSHHGGTWGIPGGARDAEESAVQAALREAAEEASVDPRTVAPEAVFTDDHGGWSYRTVLARAEGTRVAAVSPETDAMRWVPVGEVESLPLHPGFAWSWPQLRRVPAAPRMVVDAANVVGSRPDGWWRDRSGATARLRDEIAAVRSWPADRMPEPWRGPDVLRWLPSVIMVVEGQAGGVGSRAGVETVAAAGSGDDAIVELVDRHAGEPALVITAERELAGRVGERGAVVAGPRWLLDLTDAGGH